MHHDHQRIRKQTGARKVADALIRHALEGEELSGLSAVGSTLRPRCGRRRAPRLDNASLVLAALTQLPRRVAELEKRAESLRGCLEATEFD